MDLNVLAPTAQALRAVSAATHAATGVSSQIPDAYVDTQPMGTGSHTRVAGGAKLADAGRSTSSGWEVAATIAEIMAGYVSKTANYQRRSDEWIFQCNLAARDLAQIGRQIIGSLIAEQIARRDYETAKTQIEQLEEVRTFLTEKFTNEDLYAWMQGETSRLYYEYYRFAFDTARMAEQTMKRELMRPEVDATNYVKFNYWDAGRKGLLSGEALYLDLKRMEMAYHQSNERELELSRSFSLRQLNPLALLHLKARGTCEVTLPEWLFDLDCPGHYMRRIETASLSIASVTGPYTAVSCTLSLLRSTIRTSPLLSEGAYARDEGSEDSRFVDCYGTIQQIVTSSANNDSGLFDTNLRDERFLPFEGAGAISTWRLELPNQYPQFDYNTISDVILHIRYTARQGGNLLRREAINEIDKLLHAADASRLALLLSLKHEFPSEWHRFLNSQDDFQAIVKRDYFPYLTHGRTVSIDAVHLHNIENLEPTAVQELGPTALADASAALANTGELAVSFPAGAVLERRKEAQVFLLIKYSLQVG
jgi:hypothetical protein